MFEKPFSFKGRIRRTEYGVSLIIYAVLTTILNNLLASSSGDMDILGLAGIPLLWFVWAQGAKRCHDLGKNGWWQLIPFYCIWLTFQDGQRFPNEYGDNPKGLQENNPFNNFEVQSQQITVDLSDNIGTTCIEIQNANYTSVQNILRLLKDIKGVNQLQHEYTNTTGRITVQCSSNSQELLDDLLNRNNNIEVISFSEGNIQIKLR